jgi:hypothetical protein
MVARTLMTAILHAIEGMVEMQQKRWLIPPILLCIGTLFLLCGIGWAVFSGVAIEDDYGTVAAHPWGALNNRMVVILLGIAAVSFVAGVLLWPVLIIHKSIKEKRKQKAFAE